MIEVEKKFQPTEEQLAALLKDSEFVKEETLHDIYYDYPDYGLFKKRIYLRNRNGSFELKIQRGDGSHEEISNENEIKKYFETEKNISDFVQGDLMVSINVITNRKKYLKNDISIEVDEMDFGYKCIEIEILVASEKEAPQALEKIKALAEQYGFENQKASPKRKEYFRVKKPLLFEEFYGEQLK
ncbi:MAG: CYTH domain-containing protein [Patescibacteria group bacterium]